MGRKIATITIALGLLVTVLSPALGRSATYVMYDCQHLHQRPGSILFACADANFYIDHIDWVSWHSKSAFGRGIYHYNDCDPDCASGTFHKVKGSVKLQFRRWCSHQHKFAFKRAYEHFNRPINGRRKGSFGLQCPY